MKIQNDQIAKLCSIEQSDIVAIYPYGSRVYGTHSDTSDFDYIVVYSGNYEKDGQQYDSHDKIATAHTHSLSTWKEHLVNHKIFAIECNSLGAEYPKFAFTLNKPALRSEISAKANNSWVKSKKKIEIEYDYLTAIKSLFHSFRIPMFGIQIAKYGYVKDFSEANMLWFNTFKPMLTEKPTWNYIKEIYQPKHNNLMTEFRTYAELK